MELESLLQRCGTLEERAAALYRGWAAGARDNPPVCNLWTALAREEEEHARSLQVALRSPAPPNRGCLDVAGWEDAIATVEERLIAAERLADGSTVDQTLAAALELETTELETMRRALVALAGRPCRNGTADHAAELARKATGLSQDPHVGMLAALLLAETRVKQTT
jgi:rubrerythrin